MKYFDDDGEVKWKICTSHFLLFSEQRAESLVFLTAISDPVNKTEGIRDNIRFPGEKTSQNKY